MICLSVCGLWLVNENVTLILMVFGADAVHILLLVEGCDRVRIGKIHVFFGFFWEIVSERYRMV